METDSLVAEVGDDLELAAQGLHVAAQGREEHVLAPFRLQVLETMDCHDLLREREVLVPSLELVGDDDLGHNRTMG